MKASEKLKRQLIHQMRSLVADRQLDVGPAHVTLDFTRELPSEYEGCLAEYTASLVKLDGGQLVVTATSDNDQTTCGDADLLSLTVEAVEALAEAIQAAAQSGP